MNFDELIYPETCLERQIWIDKIKLVYKIRQKLKSINLEKNSHVKIISFLYFFFFLVFLPFCHIFSTFLLQK